MLNSDAVLFGGKQVQLCKDLFCVAQTFLISTPKQRNVSSNARIVRQHINQYLHVGSKRNDRRAGHKLSGSIIIGSHKSVMYFLHYSQNYLGTVIPGGKDQTFKRRLPGVQFLVRHTN